ncbi:MAG: type II secretion system major pseudopilin GspG [Sphingopyxis sp.]|nr:type II secretion system major pseudopilin GspG [Sphingopyxis sp.]
MEMLVVLVIIALIAAVAIPQVMRLLESAKTKAARIQLQTVSQAVSFYQLDTDRWPTTADGLTVLLEAPDNDEAWAWPYVRGLEQLRDPWGRPLIYRSPAGDDAYSLKTLGADGREGGRGEDRDVEVTG